VRVQRRIVLAVATLACPLALAVPARSQPQVQQRSEKQALAQAQARFQVSVMEGVLERAVENAAQVLNIQLRPMMPELFMWGSGARARGFRLEGYGVFFDVEVPMVRQSLTWSFQVMGRPDDALKALRDHVRTITDAKERNDLDRALQQIEIQFPASGATRTAGSGAASQASQTAPIDPDQAYTAAVTTAIVDSMLDHSGPLAIGSDEWLTVAARDYEGQRGVAPDAPYELVTVVMRIKGSDLQAFRAGRLSRDEARKRVELREF
jgi:hypothetical protein